MTPDSTMRVYLIRWGLRKSHCDGHTASEIVAAESGSAWSCRTPVMKTEQLNFVTEVLDPIELGGALALFVGRIREV